MPITKSAVKAARQSEMRRVRRQPYKTQLKTAMRTLKDLVKEGKKDEAKKYLSTAYKTIDTAAKKNIIHKNNAARKKSGLEKLVA